MNIHLVDGTFELFRAYYGAPGYLNPNGLEVGATRSFLRNMKNFVTSKEVTHMAIAFDSVIESFRNELFPYYKTGEGLHPEIAEQFPLVEEGARALGIVVWSMYDFEADDALATGARKYGRNKSVEKVFICSPDKDLMQCVDGKKTLCFDRLRENVFGYSEVIEKFGVEPTSIPDFLALVGDSADGIPGIPKWGAKSASTLLAHYKSLEKIPPDESQWEVKVRGARGLAENLRHYPKEAALYKKLATLRFDVPLKEKLADLKWKGPNHKEWEKVCLNLGDEKMIPF